MRPSDNYRRNTRPVGYERYKKKSGWIVKVAEPNVWKLKSRIIWEAANGPVPEGYNIRYKDGNNNNCVLENLVCVSKGVHGMLNTIFDDITNSETVDTVIAIARLKEERHKLAEKNGLCNKDGSLKLDKKEHDRRYHSTHKRVNGKWVPKD